MMKQRRKLMSHISIEKAFQSAVYVTGGGTNSEDYGPAIISKSYLMSNQKYYLLGYVDKDFAVFTYYNGVIKKIYDVIERYAISLNDTGSTIQLCFSYENKASSDGLIALTFDMDVDTAFANLFDETIKGWCGGYSSAHLWNFNLTQHISDGESKYLFVGSSDSFCVYKADGTSYSDLTAIFNHNLYLINNGETYVTLSRNNSTTLYTYGYMFLSAKG